MMDAESLKAALSTVVAIPVTPYDADGWLDAGAYAALLERLIVGGITVVTPNGNTSEFYALSRAEARLATEITVKTVSSRAKVLVGVGHDVPTAVDAAQHARDSGAELIMIHQPVHPHVSLTGWVDYHAAIAGAVPEIGVVLYVRNARIGGQQLKELGDRCQNVVGIKYAVPDPVRFAATIADAGADRFAWIAGLAEPYAPSAFAAGATGFTSGLANVAPHVSLRMLHALRGNDFATAREVWRLIRRFEELRAASESANNVSIVKEALAQLGLCRRDVRAPSTTPSEKDAAAVTEILKTWDVA
ncbi:dihydrodipicolinate synthase family protein [Fodinicola acaciae]|uniref:dihydrodipicolinate synthase family protein n=1 Tax=Fodinicola acaciae TaxID=2681555 RepID=UPI001C9E6733|nr:dihydrodipicolinate synthase family protein [Fodinicola acaciae]